MEAYESPHRVRSFHSIHLFLCLLLLTSPSQSRAHIQPGVKSKSWADRMEKTRKEKAIKLLQTELKQEKQVDKDRSAFLLPYPYRS
jgi:hypothetical protein